MFVFFVCYPNWNYYHHSLSNYNGLKITKKGENPRMRTALIHTNS